MASEMVMAYGDHGLEASPAEDVVTIGVLPMGPGNIMIPATQRYLRRAPGEGVPTKLIRVEKPNSRNGRAHVLVRYECTPFVRYTTDEGPVYGTVSGCQVRNESDASDELFSRLTSAERRRIHRAVL